MVDLYGFRICTKLWRRCYPKTIDRTRNTNPNPIFYMTKVKSRNALYYEYVISIDGYEFCRSNQNTPSMCSFEAKPNERIFSSSLTASFRVWEMKAFMKRHLGWSIRETNCRRRLIGLSLHEGGSKTGELNSQKNYDIKSGGTSIAPFFVAPPWRVVRLTDSAESQNVHLPQKLQSKDKRSNSAKDKW